MNRVGPAPGRVALFAATVGVVLADSSVVTLALPDMVRSFDTGVAEIALVLISFNLVLALAAVPAVAIAHRRGAGPLWRAGLAVFAAASLGCALAPDLWVLVAARCVQALAGAAVVASAFELLYAELSPTRAVAIWGTAGILGAAFGPAIGGALTELVSWQAIFVAQVPIALAAVSRREAPRAAAATAPRRDAPPLWTMAGLALISAALTAALFLLVVMLIEGWRLTAAQAAGVVTVMPAAALLTAPLGRRIARTGVRAATGAVTLAGGLAALGLLPHAGVGWTIAPQLLIGLGLGLSLTALTEEALAGDGRAARRAAWTIASRHAGVVLGLALLTPIFTAGLDNQTRAAQRSISALLLDAELPPAVKIRLGERLAARVKQADNRLPDLGPAFDELAADGRDAAAIGQLRSRIEDEIRRGATQAFSGAFLTAAGLALLAAGLLLGGAWRRP